MTTIKRSRGLVNEFIFDELKVDMSVEQKKKLSKLLKGVGEARSKVDNEDLLLRIKKEENKPKLQNKPNPQNKRRPPRRDEIRVARYF